MPPGYRVGPTAHHRRRSTGPIGCERTRAQVFEAVEAVLTLPALKGRKGKEAIRSRPSTINDRRDRNPKTLNR